MQSVNIVLNIKAIDLQKLKVNILSIWILSEPFDRNPDYDINTHTVGLPVGVYWRDLTLIRRRTFSLTFFIWKK